ncbi:MAG: 50S ribosomal protein L25 [Anaerolineales bacterium]|nr:50S ribosomal protein L25 [Anaerolineales bacterium]MDP3184930.1 50S ribosomal protein L25 [Anaerolineales bacterium]
MENVVVKATHRTVIGKQVRALRRAGQLPGILYGRHIEPAPISMDAREASRILSHLTSSSLVTIDLEGQEYPSLVRESQRNPIKRNLVHVDFQVVSLTEKLRTRVGIEVAGISPAVKDFNAVLVTSLDELEVECLPQHLPERIVVDISRLANVGDGIHVRDIILSENVKVLSDPEEMVVVVTASRVEEVEEVAAEAIPGQEMAEPEVIEKGKKEEEEPE